MWQVAKNYRQNICSRVQTQQIHISLHTYFYENYVGYGLFTWSSTKNSRNIRKKFAKNLRNICSRKIRKKFAKNSRKINIREFFWIFSQIFRKYFANFNFSRIFCKFFANFLQNICKKVKISQKFRKNFVKIS